MQIYLINDLSGSMVQKPVLTQEDIEYAQNGNSTIMLVEAEGDITIKDVVYSEDSNDPTLIDIPADY